MFLLASNLGVPDAWTAGHGSCANPINPQTRIVCVVLSMLQKTQPAVQLTANQKEPHRCVGQSKVSVESCTNTP